MLQVLFRKKWLLLTIVLAVSGVFYYVYKNKSAEASTQYLTGAVTRGTLTVSVSGTGQVSSSNQVEIKPMVSGKIVRVGVAATQEVKAGTVLLQLDSTEAQKAVRDAQVNFESSQLSLEKLKEPTDALTLLQAENSLIASRDNLAKLKLTQATAYDQAQESKSKAQDNITKGYEDAFNTITATFLNLPTIITKLNDILYSYEISDSESGVSRAWNIGVLVNTSDWNDRFKIQAFISAAETDYKTARAKYDEAYANYKSATRYSENSVIESLLTETLDTTKAMAQAAKSESNMLDAWADYRAQRKQSSFTKVKEYQTNLSTYISQTNASLSNLLALQRTLQDNKEGITNAERDLKEMEQNNPLDLAAAEKTVKEKEATLADLKAGPNSLDIKSQELTIRQRQNTLADAREKLADYIIRVPSDGIIAELNVKIGDQASPSAAVATLVTKQKIAEISLNEVDVARVALAQKATLTFDAVSDLTLTGQVAEIDTLGAVSQGVVSYTVKISFDTQDERIKPGMSASAAIITDVKTDVLVAPSSAVKAQGNNHYVEMLNTGNTTRQQAVEIGLSNDTETEIVSGLSEGDAIITRTITANSASTQTAPSLFGTGRSGFGGNTVRMMR